MKRIFTILILLTLAINTKRSSATVCYPTSGSWNAISFNIVFGVNTFHINGYSGSVLHDDGIVDATIAASWETGYLDRTALPPVILQQGGTYSSYAGWYTATYRQDVQVWIDFDDNGLFAASEEVSPVSGWNPSATTNPTTFNISIPAGAAVGTHRMRMRSVWEQIGTWLSTAPPHLDPCYVRYLTTNPTYRCGDIVDYFVQIVSSTPCAGTPIGGTVSAPSTVCSATNFSLSLTAPTFGSGLTYQWQSSPDSLAWTNISGATTMTYTTSQTAISYYRCLVTCTGSALSQYTAGKKILVDIPPAVGTTTGPDSVCVGSTISLTNSIAGATWSSGSSLIATVGTSGVVSGISSGVVTISYSSSNVCGTATATKVITVNPLPFAGTLLGSGVCVGSTTTLTSTAPGGSWSSSAPAIGTVGTSGIVTGVAVGVTNISYTVINSCGTDIASAPVTVITTISPGTITGTLNICPGGTTTLSDAVPGGFWSSVTPGIATITSTGVVASVSSGTTTISYSLTNSCGTTAATAVVTVNPWAVAGIISGTTKICVGATVTLGSSVTGGTWNSGATGVATIDTAGIVSGIAAGTTIITYSVTNSCGTATNHKIITVETPLVPPTLTGTTSELCPGSTTTLSVTPGGGTYSSATGNTSISGNIVTAISAGSDTVYYTITNSCGPVSTGYSLFVFTTEQCDSAAGIRSTTNAPDKLSISPNPGTDNITIGLFSTQNKDVQFIITNVAGQTVATLPATANQYVKLDIDLPAGVFYVTAVTRDGVRVEKLLVVR